LGLLSKVFGQSKEKTRQKRQEEQMRWEAFQKGRQSQLRKRAFKEGKLSTRPFSEKLGAGLSGANKMLDMTFGEGFGFGSPQPRREKSGSKKHKQKKKRRNEFSIFDW
jgi:hypothetical protein